MLPVREDPLALVVDARLVDIGADPPRRDLDAFGHAFPVVGRDSREEGVLRHDHLGVPVSEILRLRLVAALRSVDHLVRPQSSPILGVLDLGHVALVSVVGPERGVVPSAHRVRDPGRDRGDGCALVHATTERDRRPSRPAVHHPELRLHVSAELLLLELLRPDQQVVAVVEEQHTQERVMVAEVVREVPHKARLEVDLGDVPEVAFYERDPPPVRGPVRPLAVVEQLVVVRRRIVEDVGEGGGRVRHQPGREG